MNDPAGMFIYFILFLLSFSLTRFYILCIPDTVFSSIESDETINKAKQNIKTKSRMKASTRVKHDSIQFFLFLFLLLHL